MGCSNHGTPSNGNRRQQSTTLLLLHPIYIHYIDPLFEDSNRVRKNRSDTTSVPRLPKISPDSNAFSSLEAFPAARPRHSFHCSFLYHSASGFPLFQNNPAFLIVIVETRFVFPKSICGMPVIDACHHVIQRGIAHTHDWRSTIITMRLPLVVDVEE